MKDFNNLGVPAALAEVLACAQITVPTPVQEEAIPPAMQGQDILASAQTGSGKTLAYLLPLVNKMLNSPSGSALVLLPTRELAIQVKDSLQKLFGKMVTCGWAVIIGGEPILKQLTQLRRKPRIIIGTPGRICDHLERGTLSLAEASFLVLDEVDRMLDMGFSEQLDIIRSYLPAQRQTLFFSATVPANIERVAQRYLRNPQRVAIGASMSPAAEIKQEVVFTTFPEKFNRLLTELEVRQGSIIVFVRTKRGAEQLAWNLRDNKHSVMAIHGDLQQKRRVGVVQAFRKQEVRIIVATDVAARGLDVPHVQHVINYDLPGCPEDYVHRIGRTGRAGATGCAVSLVANSEDAHKWSVIDKVMNLGSNITKTGKPFETKPSHAGFQERSRGRSFSSAPGHRRRFSRPFRPSAA